MQSYLDQIIRLSNELSGKDLAIPDPILIAYTLSKLTPEYGSVISVISQQYRQKQSSRAITIEMLYSQLIDESRRLKTQEI